MLPGKSNLIAKGYESNEGIESSLASFNSWFESAREMRDAEIKSRNQISLWRLWDRNSSVIPEPEGISTPVCRREEFKSRKSRVRDSYTRENFWTRSRGSTSCI